MRKLGDRIRARYQPGEARQEPGLRRELCPRPWCVLRVCVLGERSGSWGTPWKLMMERGLPDKWEGVGRFGEMRRWGEGAGGVQPQPREDGPEQDFSSCQPSQQWGAGAEVEGVSPVLREYLR